MSTSMEIENKLGIPFCKRQNLAFVRGKGNRVWDSNDKEYLDFTSGWGVTSLGHCHPAFQQAISRQAGMLTQNPNSGFSYSPVRAELMQLLAPLLPEPLSRIYFVNSGAEANDAAIKMARKITGRPGIVSTQRAFHGRTLNTLAVSGSAEAAAEHQPQFAHNRFVPFGDLLALSDAINKDTAAVIVEPVQGEGGVRLPDPGYLASARELCHAQGALLIIDEIQTGIGRTGKLFAIEHSAQPVLPDMMTLGKGLGGGFPIAALLMSEDLAARVNVGDHGGTYCGNPLACATALAVMQFIIAEDVVGNVQQMEAVMHSALQQLQTEFPDILLECRGKGLLWALQLQDDEAVQFLSQACLDQGLLLTPTRNGILRLIPSLLVTAAEIHEALGCLRRALLAGRAPEFALDCGADEFAQTS